MINEHLSSFFPSPWKHSCQDFRVPGLSRGRTATSVSSGDRGERPKLPKATGLALFSSTTHCFPIQLGGSQRVLSSGWNSQSSNLKKRLSVQNLLRDLHPLSGHSHHTQCPSPPLAGLSSGSVCGAVVSPCGAATWCGPALLGASWVMAGPSCIAAWTAQCCDPDNTPWGTPGTDGEQESNYEITCKKTQQQHLDEMLIDDKQSYLRVHVRVPAPFALSQTFGLPPFQQLTPESFLRVKPVHTEDIMDEITLYHTLFVTVTKPQHIFSRLNIKKSYC